MQFKEFMNKEFNLRFRDLTHENLKKTFEGSLFGNFIAAEMIDNTKPFWELVNSNRSSEELAKKEESKAKLAWVPASPATAKPSHFGFFSSHREKASQVAQIPVVRPEKKRP